MAQRALPRRRVGAGRRSVHVARLCGARRERAGAYLGADQGRPAGCEGKGGEAGLRAASLIAKTARRGAPRSSPTPTSALRHSLA
jgi:hypothetical protein